MNEFGMWGRWDVRSDGLKWHVVVPARTLHFEAVSETCR